MKSLTRIPFAGGTPVTKTFPQWGIADSFHFAFRSQVPDSVDLTLPGKALLDSEFNYRDRVIITLDDKQFFCGYVDDPAIRKGSGSSNQTALHLAGPWWFLENQSYLFASKQYSGVDGDGNPVFTNYFYNHFTLNITLDAAFNSVYIQSRAQIIAILDWAISKGAWLQYQAADILDVPVRPRDVLNVTCAQALRMQVEDVDAVMWFDHTQNPPRFYAKRRSELGSITRAIATDVQDVTIKQRFDLAVPYVRIDYADIVTTADSSFNSPFVDIFPNPPPPDDFKALIVSVPLRPSSSYTLQQYIQTETIDLASLQFWKNRKPEMNATIPAFAATAPLNYANLSLVAASGARTGVQALPRIIVSGGYCAWMGGAMEREDLTVNIKFNRIKSANVPASKISEQQLRCHAIATSLNYPGGATVTKTIVTDVGESPAQFAGLAQLLFTDLNAPAWEGSVRLIETKYSGELTLGQNLNLSNGRTEWATMAALMQEISGNCRTGAIYYDVSVGPNKRLSPDTLVSRMRGWRLSYVTPQVIARGPRLALASVGMAVATASNVVTEGEPLKTVGGMVGDFTPRTS